jgi:hypothetical protein
MTVPPLRRPYTFFDANAFSVRAPRTFEGPVIESRVPRLNPRKVHLRGAFWAPRAIVYVRACRHVFELRHVRLQTGYGRELLPDPQPPALAKVDLSRQRGFSRPSLPLEEISTQSLGLDESG